MLEFSGQNFQCWPDFRIKVDGLTILYGDTNKGKSALYRGLKGILRNEISLAAIKTGTAGTSLSLTNGQTIQFSRPAKGSAEYIVGTKRYAKLAGQVPPEIQKLGFGEITIGSFKFDPIFSDQFDTPFLLKSSPQELNAVLGAFASTEKLEYGKKIAAGQILHKNQEAKALAGEIGEAEERRSRLGELQGKVEAIAEALPALENEAARLSNLAIYCRSTKERLSALVPIEEILNQLSVPDLAEAERLQQLLFTVESVLGAECALRQSSRTLTVCNEVATLWTELVGCYKLGKTLNEAVGAKTSTARTTAVGLNRIIGEVEEILPDAQDLQDRIKLVQGMKQSYILTKDARDRLVANAFEFDHAVEACDNLEGDIAEAQRAAEQVECPKCHHRFNPASVATDSHECG